MLELLDARDPAIRDRLEAGPVAELGTWSDLEIAYIDFAAQSPDCTIAGAYVDTIEPPRIGIVPGTFSRREAFTALHELGHHLQRTQIELAEDLPGQPDRGRQLEEMTSDAFAAAILIPPALATEHLGGSTPTAAQVARLWRAGQASRAAVCVRAVQNLASPGHVVLLDADGVIVFSASYADYPLRRGLDESQTEIVRAVRTSNAGLVSRKTSWLYANDVPGQEMYAQVTRLGDYFVVVSVVDGAPWERIALSAPKSAYYKEWHSCVNCGHVMRTYGAEICPTCGDPKCGECGRCACPSRVSERTCRNCFTIKPAQLFKGDSEVCRECLS
ncbi:MAG: hypothetical protein JWP19_2200 [Rhodoglobus sp.]|nr:hypothetical protein [Rhodoglobus sp.]